MEYMAARKGKRKTRPARGAYGFVRFRVPSRSDVFTLWYRDFARASAGGCPVRLTVHPDVFALRVPDPRRPGGACAVTGVAAGLCRGQRMYKDADILELQCPGPD